MSGSYVKSLDPKVEFSWRAIPNTDGYEATACGQIRRRFPSEPVRFFYCNLKKDNLGYKFASISQRWTRVHRLVYATFGAPLIDGLVICHLDGNPSNNHISNLAQLTQAENMSHCVDHGTQLRGDKAPWAKITEAQVRALRDEVKGMRKTRTGRLPPGALKALSEKFGLGYECVAGVTKRTTKIWRHV